ncbi:MAG: response regulator [Ilumatobacteraceae bacterium]
MDDSVVVRRLVTDVLSEDPEIEIIGTANNGRVGVDKVEELKPDLVTLDIEMPEMNGLEALQAIRKRHPRLPIIMFSTLTQNGASSTLDALALGASDYVTKPANVGSITQGMQAIREQLTPKIHALCKRGALVAPIRPVTTLRSRIVPTSAKAPIERLAEHRDRTRFTIASPSAAIAPHARPPASARALPCLRRRAPGSRSGRVDLVVIGSSTGGPNALATVFAALPRTSASRS